MRTLMLRIGALLVLPGLAGHLLAEPVPGNPWLQPPPASMRMPPAWMSPPRRVEPQTPARATPQRPAADKSQAGAKPVASPATGKRKLCWKGDRLDVCP